MGRLDDFQLQDSPLVELSPEFGSFGGLDITRCGAPTGLTYSLTAVNAAQRHPALAQPATPAARLGANACRAG
jgi:hypothetical protein